MRAKHAANIPLGRMARPEEIASAVVMALVGHESGAMSQRYTHVGKESLNKAAALPEL
jgi:hypothetical protein